MKGLTVLSDCGTWYDSNIKLVVFSIFITQILNLPNKIPI